MNAPLEDNYLYVYNQPHLYHLTRLDDAYPRYAALLTDANTARIFVFGLGETLETEEVKGKKVQRVKVGGWSQARYQRRVETRMRTTPRKRSALWSALRHRRISGTSFWPAILR